VEANLPFALNFFLKVRKGIRFLEQELGFFDDLMAEREKGGVGVFAGGGATYSERLFKVVIARSEATRQSH
jgi:hypothetical protein